MDKWASLWVFLYFFNDAYKLFINLCIQLKTTWKQQLKGFTNFSVLGEICNKHSFSAEYGVPKLCYVLSPDVLFWRTVFDADR